MKEQKHSYSQRIGKTTFIVNVKQSESAKKPLNTVFQDICKHEVLGGFFTDKSFNLENPQKYLDKLNPEGLSGAILYSLRNSPPDCFSQMLTHLELRVSCTACNSLIALYKIIIYKNVGPDAHIRPLVPDFIKALRSILFPPPCGQDEFGPVRPGGGAGQHGVRCNGRKHPPTGSAAQRRMLRLPALLQMVAGQVHIPGQAKPVRIQNAQVIIRCGQRWAPPLQLTENINPRCRCQAIRPHRRHVGKTDRVCGNCLPHSTMGDQPSQPGKITLGHAVPDPLAQGGQAAAFFHLTLHCFTNLFAAA